MTLLYGKKVVSQTQVFLLGGTFMRLQRSIIILTTAFLFCSSMGCTEKTENEDRLHIGTTISETQSDGTLPIKTEQDFCAIETEITSQPIDMQKQTTAKTTYLTTVKTTTEKITKTPKMTTKNTIQSVIQNTIKSNKTTKQNIQDKNIITNQNVSDNRVALNTTMVTQKTNAWVHDTPKAETSVVTEPVLSESTEKYLSLSDGVMQGDGIVVSGNGIWIQAAGIYHLSGDWNGSICVQVGNEDKVKLRLEGVSIQSQGMPAIQVQNADKVTLTVVDGTNNYLTTYGTDAENDAAIYSRDDLTIKGNGSLEVFCDNEHGIACNNDLEIENSTLSVTAEKTAIFAHQSILISGGTIIATGNNTGIRCKDWITITGGYVIASGGKKADAERGGLVSDTGILSIEGGTILAVGKNNTQPNAVQPVMQLQSLQGIPKEHTVAFCMDGIEKISLMTHKKVTNFLFSCSDLMVGSDVDIYDNGVCIGTYFQDGVISYCEIP